MGFLQVLHQFENEIINNVCKEVRPEDMLTKTYIANAFLEFVKNLEVEEDDTYYLRWYEEEHNKNSKLSIIDFIYHTVLGIQDKMDISEEYLCLYNSALEYKSVLEQKKTQFENELRTLAKDKKNKNKMDKIIYYKREIENRLNKRELLASIGQTKDAKRTAVAHCIFNISGCLLFIWFVKPFAVLIQHISPKGPEIEVISRQIANAHTLFNITMTLIWVCLINVMVKIVMTLIPDGKAVDMNPAKPVFLDDKIISQPAAALQLVAKEILRVSEMVKVVVADTITIVKTEDLNELEPLQEKGVQIKKLTDQITEYLASLFSAGTMTEQQAAQTASLMYILSDVERMGTLSVEVAKCVREKVDNRYKYTPEAMDELQKSLKTLEKMFNDSLKALQGDESVQIEKLIKRKDKIMDLDLKMRKAHVQRVNKGKCKASLTAPFTNILHLIDRMGNSCVNLADVASNEISLNYFMVN